MYIELPFMEDVREYEFAPVYNDQVRPNQEQLDSVDGLIDSMMLSTEDDRSVVLSVPSWSPTLNPTFFPLVMTC